jgi:hypothetical protein
LRSINIPPPDPPDDWARGRPPIGLERRGAAVCPRPAAANLSVGSHSITVTFDGTASYATSSDSVTQVVRK